MGERLQDARPRSRSSDAELFELRMTSIMRKRSASSCARLSAWPCFEASRDCFMRGEIKLDVSVGVEFDDNSDELCAAEP